MIGDVQMRERIEPHNSAISCLSLVRNLPGLPVPALEITRPMSRSSVKEESCLRKPSLGEIESGDCDTPPHIA